MKFYKFGLMPVLFMCGGGAPPPPPPPPPPPQVARQPEVSAVRKDVQSANIAQGGVPTQSSLLTSGLGDPTTEGELGRKTLLGG